MTYYRRRGPYRLRGYDYGSTGVYFITICTHNREHFFGEIRNGIMQLSTAGQIVEEEWQKTPDIRYSLNVALDVYCIMPNHFHALLIIGDPNLPRYSYRLPPTDAIPTSFGGSHSQTVGAVIRGFKGSCTKRIRIESNRYFGWQKRFHDHIVRDLRSWEAIREYIVNNPQRWKEDRFHRSH